MNVLLRVGMLTETFVVSAVVWNCVKELHKKEYCVQAIMATDSTIYFPLPQDLRFEERFSRSTKDFRARKLKATDCQRSE